MFSILITFCLSCNLMVVLLRNKYRYNIIKSFSHSADLSEVAARWWQHYSFYPQFAAFFPTGKNLKKIQSRYAFLSSISMPTLTVGLLFLVTTAFYRSLRRCPLQISRSKTGNAYIVPSSSKPSPQNSAISLERASKKP